MLAVVVIAIVGMMIVPLPTFLLDILLTINISLSVIILLISLYIPGALHICGLPDAAADHHDVPAGADRLDHAPHPAPRRRRRGDATRSATSWSAATSSSARIIFLILTMVHFIVIAKGSERVAEVAARFTLDAMPGKQMSIDADLRAGVDRHGGGQEQAPRPRAREPALRRDGRRDEVRQGRRHRRHHHHRHQHRRRPHHRRDAEGPVGRATRRRSTPCSPSATAWWA